MSDILTLQEAATILKTTLKVLRIAIKHGRLKAARIGREYRVTSTDLNEYWKASGGTGVLIQNIQADKQNVKSGELFS